MIDNHVSSGAWVAVALHKVPLGTTPATRPTSCLRARMIADRCVAQKLEWRRAPHHLAAEARDPGPGVATNFSASSAATRAAGSPIRTSARLRSDPSSSRYSSSSRLTSRRAARPARATIADLCLSHAASASVTALAVDSTQPHQSSSMDTEWSLKPSKTATTACPASWYAMAVSASAVSSSAIAGVYRLDPAAGSSETDLSCRLPTAGRPRARHPAVEGVVRG